MRDEPPIEMVDIDLIDMHVQPWLSCRYFSDREVDLLAASIEQNGGRLDQPIALRRISGEKPYALIFGLRRCRGARKAGAKQVPARVYDVSDEVAALMSLRENIPRINIGLMQRGWAFARLEDGGMAQVQIGKVLGESTSSVCEGIQFARALPESLLLKTLADLEVTGDPRELVFRTVRLSKRTLKTIRDAARNDDHGPLRVAIEAIVSGKSKAQTTRAVSAATRSAKAPPKPSTQTGHSEQDPLATAAARQDSVQAAAQLLAELRTEFSRVGDLLELSAANGEHPSHGGQLRPSLVTRIRRWVHRKAQALLRRVTRRETVVDHTREPVVED